MSKETRRGPWTGHPAGAATRQRPRSSLEPARRQVDRGDDLRVARAPADVAGQRFADLCRGRVWHARQEVVRGNDQARRAEAALHRARFEVCVLYRVQALIGRKPFHRYDLAALCLATEHQARADELAIQVYGARAALALLARVLRAGQAEMLAQHV